MVNGVGGLTHLSSLLLPAAAIVLLAIVAGCTPSATPSGSIAATPSDAEQSEGSPGVSTPVVTENATISPPAADVVEAVPSTEGVLNAMWVDDRRVVVGGFEGPASTSAIRVFDGRSWSISDVPEAPGQVTGITKFGDRLIAVGNGLPDTRNGFIWESADGRTWRTLHTIADAAIYDVTSGDDVIVAAGARLDAEMNAMATAWISTDGTTWDQAEVADDAGTAMGSVVATSDGFAATGDRPLGQPRLLWVATVPTSWAAQENDLSDQLLPIDLVHGNDLLALVGASGKSGDQHPFVALSAGGLQWDRTDLSSAEGYASAVAAAGDLLIVAGVESDRLTVWFMRADSWESQTIEERDATISALAWDATGRLVAAGARGGQHALWVFEEYGS